MNNRIFLRLSSDNIKKNAKMYVPYILTCVLMTAMIYIIRSLSLNPDLSDLRICNSHSILFKQLYPTKTKP